MPKVTFELTPRHKRLMERFPEANWSAVFRRAVLEHAAVLEMARAILAEKDDPRVRSIADLLERGMVERFEKAARRARRR